MRKLIRIYSIRKLFILASLGIIFGVSGGLKPALANPKPTPDQLEAVNRAIERQFPNLVKFSAVAPRCVECHAEQERINNLSIHGKAELLKNLPAGALCLTCHEFNHLTNPVKAIEKAVFSDLLKGNVHPPDVSCMRCHQDKTIAAVFSFAPHVPTEFEHSIHYRKAMLGDKRAPLCFDCHGTHTVRAVTDPSSSVYEGQKTKVCANCHSGANATFASTFDHKPIDKNTKPVEFWTISMFKALTLGTFLALGLLMFLDVFTYIRMAITPAHKRGHAHPISKDKVRYVKRLDTHLRIQHFLMLASVITLAITGWPMFEPTSASAHLIVRAFGGAVVVPIVHRIAGVVMIGDLFYHLVYLYSHYRSGKRNHPMLPKLKDAADVWQLMLYYFGIASKKPEFEQFSFIEKFDYWAVFWGVAMMGVSGLVLMFPTVITRLFPALAVKISLIIHADEALLAATVLFIWHFYNVHLKPGIFPMNWAWLTGRMRSDIYEEEHTAHVKDLKAKGKWDIEK